MLDDNGWFGRCEESLTITSYVEGSQDKTIICCDFDGLPRESILVHEVREPLVLFLLISSDARRQYAYTYYLLHI